LNDEAFSSQRNNQGKVGKAAQNDWRPKQTEARRLKLEDN